MKKQAPPYPFYLSAFLRSLRYIFYVLRAGLFVSKIPTIPIP